MSLSALQGNPAFAKYVDTRRQAEARTAPEAKKAW